MAMCSVHQLPRTHHPGKPGYTPGLYLDEVRDDLPFSRPRRKIAHGVLVKSDVEKIFLYREMKIRELSG
jgi:hypothetical protein